MKSQWIFRLSGYLAVLIFAAAISARPLPAQNPDSEKINQLLAQAKSHAVQLEDDADLLVAFTRSHVSWEAHADKLRAMSTDVNEMGKIVSQLQAISSEGSAWQKVAIDRIYPMLRDMADELTTTIKFLSAHQSQVNMPPYQDYAHANYDLASRTSSLVGDLVAYGKAKSDSSAIQQRLELPAKD